MNLSAPEAVSEERARSEVAFSGVALVFRGQMRGRRFGRALLGASALVLLLFALAAGVLSRFFGEFTVYDGNNVRFLSNWATTEMILAALVIPAVGAVLGAGAVPVSAEREAIQATLLTRLTAWDIATGRLLAALSMPIGVLGVSSAVGLAAERSFRIVPGRAGGLGAIVAVHTVLLAALLMSGAVAFLFALRSRPGRSWERGTLFSLSLSIICVFALFTLNGPIRRMENPRPLIEAALLINPVVGVCSALNKDILRVPWIYSRTEAPEYAFEYPPSSATAGVLTLMALAAQIASSIRLRRSYLSKKES